MAVTAIIAATLSSVPGRYWTVTNGAASCEILNETCITDGPGAYGIHESCTIRAEISMTVSTYAFDTESRCDMLTLNGTAFSGALGPDRVMMPAGSTMTWVSDKSIVRDGFVVCGTL